MLSLFKRECGNCDVCCELAAVPELDKPSMQRCVHLEDSPSGCCSIVGTRERPDLCSSYQCAWLEGFGGPEDRPDKVGAMFSRNVTERGRIGFAVETKPNALRTTAKRMAVQFAKKNPMPIIVSEYGETTAGEWVVIRNDLIPKAQQILGLIVEEIGEDVTMFVRREPVGANT